MFKGFKDLYGQLAKAFFIFPLLLYHNRTPVIASDLRERGNLHFSRLYEIASVALLLRNDIMKQSH
jgi:hypothetical protein